MENEILLYPNKKGLEGVIALTRTRPLTCNQLKTAPPAFIESARVLATRPSASRQAF